MKTPFALRLIVLGFVMLAGWAPPSRAQSGLIVSGRVEHPATLSAADLAALPQTTVTVNLHSEHGDHSATFSGPLLWTILSNAALVDEPGKHTHLLHAIVARGEDGYAVTIAIGELDPLFENKQAIVATTEDGKPLANARLVVPGDLHAGRAVHDLAGLEVR